MAEWEYDPVEEGRRWGNLTNFIADIENSFRPPALVGQPANPPDPGALEVTSSVLNLLGINKYATMSAGDLVLLKKNINRVFQGADVWLKENGYAGFDYKQGTVSATEAIKESVPYVLKDMVGIAAKKLHLGAPNSTNPAISAISSSINHAISDAKFREFSSIPPIDQLKAGMDPTLGADLDAAFSTMSTTLKDALEVWPPMQIMCAMLNGVINNPAGAPHTYNYLGQQTVDANGPIGNPSLIQKYFPANAPPSP